MRHIPKVRAISIYLNFGAPYHHQLTVNKETAVVLSFSNNLPASALDIAMAATITSTASCEVNYLTYCKT